MRILIIGNCQVVDVANCMRQLVPDAVVEAAFLFRLKQAEIAELAQQIEKWDVVLTQPMRRADHPLNTPKLQKRTRVHVFPTITFSGFHPDFLTGIPHRAAAGNYHSAIVMAAFLLGLSAKQTTRLFNAFVYETLGYFGTYAVAREFLLSRAAKLGYRLDAEFSSWEASGVFMHSLNHPSKDVMASLARCVAAQAGLASPDAALPAAEPDAPGSSGVICPVYPEIAQRLGVPGSTRIHRPDRTLTLDEFVLESYESYESADRELLMQHAGSYKDRLQQVLV
jgi:hypothetical protein